MISAADVAHAQTGLATEGALFLLLPVGARSVGMGQAVVADRPGTEARVVEPGGNRRGHAS